MAFSAARRDGVIHIHGLRFGYGPQPVYANFDLSLDAPGLYGLFGRNGSGKSTLLKLMAGLVFPQAGQIRAARHEPRWRAAQFLAQVFIVPEEFHLPNLSCRQLEQRQAGFYPRFDAALFERILDTFELDPATRFEQMSLGNKKKATLAFALAARTPILLLDEPTNGLDMVARDRFRELLRQPEQADRAILISTHQAHDLERLIARILFIDAGRLALASPMDTLATRLRTGVCEHAQLAAIPDLIYQEDIGTQVAFIARRHEPEDGAVIQLELLYRALCRQPETVLAAIHAAEVTHV